MDSGLAAARRPRMTREAAMIDRRAFLGASAFAASAPFSISTARAQDAAYFADLHEKAKKEGEISWYLTHWRTETAERVGNLFMQTFPGVRCNVVRSTGQVLFQRLIQEFKARVPVCDVYSSSELGQYVILKKEKRLTCFTPKNQVHCLPAARDYDPDHDFTITDANTTVMAYNRDIVTAAEAPKNWTDLIDPKWKNQVAVCHPGFSGSGGGWAVTMEKLYGWSFFEKLKANAPLVTRSIIDTVNVMATGERKIGIGPGSLTVNQAAAGRPIETVYPSDGTILGFGPSGILSTSPHPNAAKLFVEFLLSREVVEIAAAEYNIPVRADVEPKPGIAKLGTMKGLNKSPEELSEKLPELIEKWRDTFGV
jgi:iron(III) transport system substrate-binding protein